MSGKSLRLRLALAATISIALALLLAGFVLSALFERHVNRHVEAELDGWLLRFATEVGFTPEGALQLGQAPGDPRFEQPFSGHYWQIDDDREIAKLRSRSLWDHVISLPKRSGKRHRGSAAVHSHLAAGPQESSLLVRERYIAYPSEGQRREVRIMVALDRKQIIDTRRAFAGDITLPLALLAGILMLASLVQIVVGLRPLEALRRSVMAVRSGERKRIEVDEPEEVMPLVAEVNSLLEAQSAAIERARTRAADLAHGLKTPLTVMALDAERLRQKGETALADEIEDLASGMRRHIGRELTRARLDSTARVKAPVAVRDVLDGVTRTLSRTPKGAQIKWTVDVPASASAAMREEDLAELIGNLLDNAVKWAESEVRITAARGPLALVIEDDGPGVTADQLDRLGERGIRLDMGVEGTGLGLAIARDILDAYGGTMAFANRAPHGLNVTVRQD
jgi:signal transduction histidine kinase